MADVTLTARINTLIVTAMKAKDAGRLGALRMLKAAVMNRGVEKGRDLDDAEVLVVVSQLVKQRRDSIEQFAAAGRQDLVDKESAELVILEEFQPPAASAVEIDAAVAAAMLETGATSPKDMGKVMKAVQAGLAGKTVDGRAVSEAVKARLAGL
ncbi:MAG: GatB/YqeY domain-containing protein [Vicinamibacterales bacterium]